MRLPSPSRAAAALALALAAAGPTGCASARPPALSAEAAAWAEGPVRWLLLAEERRELARLRARGELALFRESFWLRRDPTPEDPENPALATFLERVEIADRLYDQGDLVGSRSDRGRAFILLGPPSRIRLARPDEAGGGSSKASRPAARVESWGWVAADLEPGFRRRLPPAGGDGEWRVVFRLERGRARLIAGEPLLESAAAAWLRPPPERPPEVQPDRG
jgi:GWxTD domain-containing protein